MPRGVLLTANLPQLQNLIKRDPQGYKEEFLQQWTHFQSVYQIFQSNPLEQPEHFRETVAFLSQVASCYPVETKDFPSKLSSLLLTHFHVLSSDLRKALIQNVVLLRNKGVITAIELLQCLFPLLSNAASSNLQGYLRDIIVTDIRTANIQSKNHKLNNAVQAMLFAMVDHNVGGPALGNKGKARHTTVPTSGGTRPPGEEALWAIIVASDLWKRQIWMDAKTITIISLGCFHPVCKVQSAAAHFFLESEGDEVSDDESTHIDPRALQHRREINKKTRSADKKFKKAMNKHKSKKTKKVATNSTFPALDLLQDPQAFAERLYDNLNQNDRQFSLDHKILLLQLLSRIMAAHKLCVLGFYSYIMKYLAYRQIRIPSILAALAQSVHDLTPPDVLVPIVKKLAQEFVHPGVSGEVITAGINSVREVCRRQPWAIEEDLLGDLVEYRRSRDKSVVAAARGLLQLYREVNPSLLKKRERGKEASINAENRSLLPFGHRPSVSTGIEGLALLEEQLAGQEDHDDGAWGKWEMDSDPSEESDSSQGWIDVSDEGQDLALSDSDSEDEADVSNTQSEGNQDSTLAQTKILTPGDFTMLHALRLGAAKKAADATGTKITKRKVAALEDMQPDVLSDGDILGPRKKAKADYEERLASIHKGREGREKYGSRKGKEKELGSSTTNKEKAKNKPVMMILSSGSIRGKQKASLRDKQKKLRAHITRSRKSR